MNSDFPPLELIQPQVIDRRKEAPRFIPPSADIIARRGEIARQFGSKVDRLSEQLRSLTDEQRKAIFYKLQHDIPIDLTGTDLKAISKSDEYTLAIPKKDNMDKFLEKIKAFGEGPINRGNVPNSRLIAHLLDIKPGEPKDRLSQALFDKYDELVCSARIVCEIEIISLAQGLNQQRAELHAVKEKIYQAFGRGIHGNFFEHEETYGTLRAVIWCTGNMFQKLVEEENWQRTISWFDEKPKFETFSTVFQEFEISNLGDISSPDENAAIVCIVDTGVTAGNPFLIPVSKEDLFRSYLHKAADNPYDEHGHGSGVASLASYYALNIDAEASNEGKVWIASARILDEQNELEEERLFSKVLIEVVEDFVPLGIRIFNLSANIINRHWNKEAKRTVPRNSWVARTIDRLSREHDIIFVVSTGNIRPYEVRQYLDEGKTYPDYLFQEDARILDPAQSSHALTVGGVALNTLVVAGVTRRALAEQYQPAPFTRSGPGISREVKPELVDFGGNYVQETDTLNQVGLNAGTNVMMASHQSAQPLRHDSGTSFSTPRVAHKLSLVLQELNELGIEHPSACLLKAFLINSANYPSGERGFDQFIEEKDKEQWMNLYGYGIADAVRATSCDDFSTVLFYQGYIEPDKVAYFDVPIPASLAEARENDKRLTVTVVNAPEVQRWGLEKYHGTIFKWRMFRGDINREEVIAAMSVEEESEVTESEIPKEIKFTTGITIRSRGTVQHDTFAWKRHGAEYSENHYTLAIAAYQKWGRRTNPVPFAVVVRIEETSRQIPIYSEIDNILTEIRVTARSRF